jgi:hypothetical protein
VSSNADKFDRNSGILYDADQVVVVVDDRERPLVSERVAHNFDMGDLISRR